MSDLSTAYETNAFIHLLTIHKLDRPTARWATIYDLVIAPLQERYGIVTSRQKCEVRRKSLSDSYRNQSKHYGQKKIEWPFYCAMAKLNRRAELSCAVVGHTTATCPSHQANWGTLTKPVTEIGFQVENHKIDEVGKLSKGKKEMVYILPYFTYTEILFVDAQS